MSRDSSAPVTVTYLTERTDTHALFKADVLYGFTAYRKYLPSKYFYDARGSQLFEQITSLPEYYLTRAETEILSAVADDVMDEVQPDELIELGSGSSTKTLLLIGAMERHGGRRYVPIDVSESALRGAASQLADRYDWLEVDAMVGDYVTNLAKVRRRGRRVIVFLGSTIGNYVPTTRYTLLRSVSAALAPGDRILLGVDLVKAEATMLAAYDDAQGVSAEFNRNILRVVNNELGGDIPVDEFE
ncbi:MAG: L-histidine N(alpha)-methyltransferase, partial [Acidimicrobiia bacterium]|nr:L-histidine N(alpha)-methyltransferase [Acidimicrobiia bacterium]